MSINIIIKYELEDIAHIIADDDLKELILDMSAVEEEDFRVDLIEMVRPIIVENVLKLVNERFAPRGDTPEIDGYSDEATGGIGPGYKYHVRNHSVVRVLVGGKDDARRDCSGMEGVIEGFNYDDVPMTVAVQFHVDGEYNGDDVREFKYYDIAPLGTEEA